MREKRKEVEGRLLKVVSKKKGGLMEGSDQILTKLAL